MFIPNIKFINLSYKRITFIKSLNIFVVEKCIVISIYNRCKLLIFIKKKTNPNKKNHLHSDYWYLFEVKIYEMHNSYWHSY